MGLHTLTELFFTRRFSIAYSNSQDASMRRLTGRAGPDILEAELLEGILMMLRMANLVSTGALLAMLAGCTTVEERLELRKPTATLVGVRLQEATVRAATLVFDVNVVNHYPASVPLTGFRYSVASAGRTFLVGSSEARINLPANGQRTVALPVTIDYLGALKALSNVKPGGTIPYEAKLDLTVETPRLGPLNLFLSRAGDLTLPAISEALPQDSPGALKTQ
jgi:LEA14-like dessication related protein